MKILHVAETITGGPASYLNEVVSYQGNLFGFDNVEVLIPDRQRDQFVVDKIRVNTFFRSGRNLLSIFLLYFKLLSLVYGRDWDVVHLHSSFAGFVGRLIPRLGRYRRAKIVYCAHCWSFDRPSLNLIDRVSLLVERCLFRLSDLVINISFHEKSLLAKHGFPSHNVVTIISGVSDSFLVRRDSFVLSSIAPVRLLYVGRFDSQKGIDLLMDRISELKFPFVLNIVGSSIRGDGAYVRPSEFVNFLGWIPRDDVPRLMIESDFLLLPSRWEGMPLIVIEALRSGLPVIANDIPSIRALKDASINCEESGIVVIDYSRSSALGDVIEGLIYSGEFGRKSEFARINYLNNFTSSRMNADIVNSYYSIKS